MLSMVLRHEALSCTVEARAASQRIEKLFQDRPSFDYLAGNDNLWEPLQKLRAELAVREEMAAPLGGPGAEAGELVSLGATDIDPALFGMVVEGVPSVFEEWGDIGRADTVSFDPDG